MRDLVVGSEPDVPFLTVATRLDPQRRLDPHGKILDRDKVDASGLRTVHGEEFDLPSIVTTALAGIAVMAVTAAHRKANRSLPEPPSLALNAGEARAVIHDQVAARVLAKGNVDLKAGIPESQHDRELRPVTDRLWMIHPYQRACCIGWAVSRSDNIGVAYDVSAPE